MKLKTNMKRSNPITLFCTIVENVPVMPWVNLALISKYYMIIETRLWPLPSTTQQNQRSQHLFLFDIIKSILGKNYGLTLVKLYVTKHAQPSLFHKI